MTIDTKAMRIGWGYGTASKVEALCDEVDALRDGVAHWTMVAHGINHDPRCRNNVASGGDGRPCMRCERDALRVSLMEAGIKCECDTLREEVTTRNKRIGELREDRDEARDAIAKLTAEKAELRAKGDALAEAAAEAGLGWIAGAPDKYKDELREALAAWRGR